MGWFNRNVVARVAPRLALRRELAHRALLAYYEAAEANHQHKLRNDRRSGNAQAERAAVPLRTQARHLDENYDIASGILDVLTTSIVGRGITPEPQVMLTSGEPAVDFNRALMRRFDAWIYECDVAGQHHYYALQRLKARTWFRDGEVFTQRVLGNVAGLQHGTVLPYSLEALEPDYVPHDLTDATRGVYQGCEVNAWGRPRFWHVYKHHPGDSVALGISGSGWLGETKRVPARVMTQLAFRKRLHQLRGISIFASSMHRLDDIKETDENERIAARVAASMAAVIKKGSPDLYDPETVEIDADGRPVRREMFFESGIIFDELRPGEDVQTIDTKRPNNELIPFRDSQLRSAAAGTMTAKSSIAKDYSGTYSSQRQELVEQWSVYQMLGQEFVLRDAQPVWDGFIDAVLLSGSDEVPRDVDRATLYDAVHTGPVMTWIDPEKEAKALVLQMQWGLKARSRIIRERGDMPHVVNMEIKRDQEERERLGIKIGASVGEEPEELEDDDSTDDEGGERDAAETYGIAVRSGSITPQTDDEVAFRERFGYPPMSPEAIEQWKKDRGVRRPITLAPSDSSADDPPPDDDRQPGQE